MTNYRNTSVRLEQNLVFMLDYISRRLGISRSEAVRELLVTASNVTTLFRELDEELGVSYDTAIQRRGGRWQLVYQAPVDAAQRRRYWQAFTRELYGQVYGSADELREGSGMVQD